jgi:FAD dependent oxidoreductase
MKCFVLSFCILFIINCPIAQIRQLSTDVLVIGGGVGGTAAAIQCARMGVNTILVEETTMLGGMLTAAGVSCTDGNDLLPSGMWEEFRQALYKHYGRNKLNSGWVSNTNFEPHVGDSIFKAWAKAEKNLAVLYFQRFESVLKKANQVTKAHFWDIKEGASTTITAKIIIDATELGDAFSDVGAGYDLGMDDPKESGEKEAREKNNIIQDLTWAAILKDHGPGADKTIARPANYDSTLYFCSTSDAPCNGKPYAFNTKKVLDYGKLPRSPGATTDKYMLNWPPHGNDYYLNVVEESDQQRTIGYEQARQQTLGFIYFLQTQLGMKHIGLADDELNNGMALIPYNREGRRVKGIVRLNINHLENLYDYNLYRTGISVGDYPVDHHHARYPGKVPELEFPPIPSFNIPLGCLIPEKIDGLIVCEKGISVSNIVNGSTRLQPVVLLTGQAAGVLAAKSIKEKKSIRDVAVRDVQAELLKLKCYLMPFVDVKPDDPNWEAIQKVGVTGILKGVGKAEGWANKMFFYPDSLVTLSELTNGLRNYSRLIFPNYSRLIRPKMPPESIGAFFKYLKNLRGYIFTDEFKKVTTVEGFEKIWNKYGLTDYSSERPIKRYELAVIVDKCTLLFDSKNLPVGINGKIYFKYSEF